MNHPSWGQLSSALPRRMRIGALRMDKGGAVAHQARTNIGSTWRSSCLRQVLCKLGYKVLLNSSRFGVPLTLPLILFWLALFWSQLFTVAWEASP